MNWLFNFLPTICPICENEIDSIKDHGPDYPNIRPRIHCHDCGGAVHVDGIEYISEDNGLISTLSICLDLYQDIKSMRFQR